MKALYPNFDDELNYAVGMFVGLAIGDAMGAPIEFQPSREPRDYVRSYQEVVFTMYPGANLLMIHPWLLRWLTM